LAEEVNGICKPAVFEKDCEKCPTGTSGGFMCDGGKCVCPERIILGTDFSCVVPAGSECNGEDRLCDVGVKCLADNDKKVCQSPVNGSCDPKADALTKLYD
jgi:hypothetical protein